MINFKYEGSIENIEHNVAKRLGFSVLDKDIALACFFSFPFNGVSETLIVKFYFHDGKISTQPVKGVVGDFRLNYEGEREIKIQKLFKHMSCVDKNLDAINAVNNIAREQLLNLITE